MDIDIIGTESDPQSLTGFNQLSSHFLHRRVLLYIQDTTDICKKRKKKIDCDAYDIIIELY